MQFLELHGEALTDREHDGGEQRTLVGIVEPIEGSAEPIIAQVPEVLLCQAVQGRSETVHGLDLAVDGLALDHDRAQQHPKGRGVRHGAPSIGRRYVLIQQLDQPEPPDEVIDEGKRPQPLRDQSELPGEWLAGLHRRHSGDNNIASS